MAIELAPQSNQESPIHAEVDNTAPTYDVDTKEAGWDSPERAQKLGE